MDGQLPAFQVFLHQGSRKVVIGVGRPLYDHLDRVRHLCVAEAQAHPEATRPVSRLDYHRVADGPGRRHRLRPIVDQLEANRRESRFLQALPRTQLVPAVPGGRQAERGDRQLQASVQVGHQWDAALRVRDHGIDSVPSGKRLEPGGYLFPIVE